MSEAMPPAHSAPATLGPANSPLAASTGSSSDNSDSESSSRGSCSEDGPLPLASQDSGDPVTVETTSAEKGAQPSCVCVKSYHLCGFYTAAIPLSVVQTSNRDPVLTTALLPHSGF